MAASSRYKEYIFHPLSPSAFVLRGGLRPSEGPGLYRDLNTFGCSLVIQHLSTAEVSGAGSVVCF